MKAEREVQPTFRNTIWVQSLTLAAVVLLFAAWLERRPDRNELGWRSTWLRFDPLALDPETFGELRLAGAWTVTSDDPRFGGISALALASNQLVALTDSGAVIRFAKPSHRRQPASIGELPGGPGDRRFKFNRDAEALAKERMGRGWWVTFENRNELWLYDPGFRRTLKRHRLGQAAFPRNRGLEGATAMGASLLLVPEQGRSAIEWRGGTGRTFPIANPAGRISDAATLPSGELLVVNRQATPAGLANSVALLRRGTRAYAYTTRWKLGVGKLDNVEAVAPELLPGGRVRLWLMTDDNQQRPLRTLLIAVDLPARSLARQRPSSRARA